MEKGFKLFLKEAFESSPETFEEKRQQLPTTLLFAVLFFLPYYTLVLIPNYGIDSIQFKEDFFAGHFVLGGFISSILLSKKIKKDFILCLPAFGALFASYHFLTHQEFHSARPYIWIYAQLCTIIFVTTLGTLRWNLILIFLIVTIPTALSFQYEHIVLKDVIERQAVVYFIGIVIIYYVFRQTVSSKELRQFNEKANLILNSSELGTWQWNLQTNEVIFDKRWKEMLGYDEAQVENSYENWEKLVHPEDLGKSKTAFTDYLEGKVPHYEVKFRMKHKDGHWVPIISKGKVLEWDQQGTPLCFNGTHFDFSILEKLQADLENEKLKLVHSSKLATLGQMAAGVAHEINNPLAIISNANLLLKRSDKEGTKEKVALQIDQSVERISKIVNGLRKFTRVSDDFSKQRNNLYIIISETLELMEFKAKSEFVEIKRHNLKDVQVNCDSMEIQQILVNLINNAIQENAQKTDSWVQVEMSETQEMIELIIKDSGTGIDDSVIENLFNPFFTTKEVGEGTGLGLSISRSIAEQHGGSLNYELRDGHTAFVLALPMV